jgi:ubiquinone/menaquinone biosynthesis C-methylase UbiE
MAERRDWPSLAQWFDDSQGDEGDPWHRMLIYPGILKAIGPVRGREILEVACGNGGLARQLARAGNRVTGIDSSPGIIELAKLREAAQPLGINYQVCDAARLSIFENNSFDLVVTNMALMDMPDAAGAIKEMSRVVRRSGRCVMLFSHPCFDVPGASSWLIEYLFAHPPEISLRLTRYREPFSSWNRWSGTEEMELLSYHRPLSWYFRAIRDAGMAVTMFDEPEPTKEFMEQTREPMRVAKFPMHCVIEARPYSPPQS